MGTGRAGLRGDRRPATAAQLDAPSGLAVDKGATLHVTDTGSARVRKVATDGTISTLAANGRGEFTGDNGPAVAAALAPAALAVDGSGNLFVADELSSRVRRINRAGVIFTVGGNGDDG